jgi:ATP-dependent RNA helicase DBP3
MTQDARTRAFNGFRDGEVPLLIATDVAARGLDIPQVEYVINMTFPLTIEDYVHRIGRTGRAGATGIAHTFFTHADKAHAGELVNILREAGAEVPEGLLKFGTHVKKKEHALYGAHYKADEPGAGPMKAPTKIKFDEDD